MLVDGLKPGFARMDYPVGHVLTGYAAATALPLLFLSVIGGDALNKFFINDPGRY